MRLRILTDLFRQKFVRKTLQYTRYSCGFPPFSDAKSLARLSCRFVWYCHKQNAWHYLNYMLYTFSMLCYDSYAFGIIICHQVTICDVFVKKRCRYIFPDRPGDINLRKNGEYFEENSCNGSVALPVLWSAGWLRQQRQHGFFRRSVCGSHCGSRRGQHRGEGHPRSRRCC